MVCFESENMKASLVPNTLGGSTQFPVERDSHLRRSQFRKKLLQIRHTGMLEVPALLLCCFPNVVGLIVHGGKECQSLGLHRILWIEVSFSHAFTC